MIVYFLNESLLRYSDNNSIYKTLVRVLTMHLFLIRFIGDGDDNIVRSFSNHSLFLAKPAS